MVESRIPGLLVESFSVELPSSTVFHYSMGLEFEIADFRGALNPKP